VASQKLQRGAGRRNWGGEVILRNWRVGAFPETLSQKPSGLTENAGISETERFLRNRGRSQKPRRKLGGGVGEGIPENPFAETEGRWSQKAEGSPETGPAQKTRARAAKLSRETLSATVLAQTPGPIFIKISSFFRLAASRKNCRGKPLLRQFWPRLPARVFLRNPVFFAKHRTNKNCRETRFLRQFWPWTPGPSFHSIFIKISRFFRLAASRKNCRGKPLLRQFWLRLPARVFLRNPLFFAKHRTNKNCR
jgi:hypothetical protein